MTIRDQATYLRSQVDWAIFDGLWPRAIKPSDLDGFVEINGRVLYLEHKLPDAPLTEGQRRAFRAFARMGNRVITFWSEGDHQAIKRIRVDDIHGDPDPWSLQDTDLDTLRGVVAEWVAWAEAVPPPILVEADDLGRLREQLTSGQRLGLAASLIGGQFLPARRQPSRRAAGERQTSLWIQEVP